MVKGTARRSKKSPKEIPFLAAFFLGGWMSRKNSSITAAAMVRSAAARNAAGIPNRSAISSPTAGAQAEPMSWLMPM